MEERNLESQMKLEGVYRQCLDPRSVCASVCYLDVMYNLHVKKPRKIGRRKAVKRKKIFNIQVYIDFEIDAFQEKKQKKFCLEVFVVL